MGRPLKHTITPGTRFGKLVAVKNSSVVERGQNRASVVVQCDCGSPAYELRPRYLLDRKFGACAECKPRRRADFVDMCSDTGLRRRLKSRIRNAIRRCHNPDDINYRSYGAVGIRVCDPWLSKPLDFFKYVLTLPGHDDPDLDMDRVDEDRGYEPGNIQFITQKQNMQKKTPMRHYKKRCQELEAEITILELRIFEIMLTGAT